MLRGDSLTVRLVILVAFLDLFIQFPVTAPYASSLGASTTLVGVIVGAYSASNLVGNVVAGLVLDRWGRKLPVLVGLIATAVVLGSYAVAATPQQLLVARIVHGMTAAVLTPGAFTMIGDATDAEHRGRSMGTSGALIAFTAILGPSLAGITRDRLGFGAVFLGGAALMLVVAAIFARFAVERVATIERSAQRAVPGEAANWLTVATRRPLVTAYLTILCFTISLGCLVTYLPMLLTAQGFNYRYVGLAFTVYAVFSLIGMLTPLNRLSDRRGRLLPMTVGLLGIGGGLLVLGLGDATIGVWAGMGLYGAGFGLIFPAAAALVADASSPDERGTAFGGFYALYSLGVVVGATASGALADWMGVESAAPFLLSSAVVFAGAVAARAIGARPAMDRVGVGS